MVASSTKVSFGTVKSYAQIRQRHDRNRFGGIRTGFRHVRLDCRSAGRQLPVKGGKATCEALDGLLAVCYLCQLKGFFPELLLIHLSRLFMLMYRFVPHWVPVTCRSLAHTSIRAELPSGKVPTTRVRLRISQFRRSSILLVRIFSQCSEGKA